MAEVLLERGPLVRKTDYLETNCSNIWLLVLAIGPPDTAEVQSARNKRLPRPFRVTMTSTVVVRRPFAG